MQENITNQLLIGAAILNFIVLAAFTVSIINFFIFLKNIKQLLYLATACTIQSVILEKERIQRLLLMIIQDKKSLFNYNFNLKEKEK